MRQRINVEDYRRAARRRLPRVLFDYVEGGAEDEFCLQRNRDAFRRLRLRARRLTDISSRDLSTELLGSRLALPLIIAPTGLNGMLWPDGDLALARAARK